MDKVILYIFVPFLGTDKIKQIHRKLNRHHQFRTEDELQNLRKVDIREIVIDWESARYTKPDKPETARRYAERKHPQLLPLMMPYLNKWKI